MLVLVVQLSLRSFCFCQLYINMILTVLEIKTERT